jgi:ABC-type branched-subunit amino acid transport system substrate-binding protein
MNGALDHLGTERKPLRPGWRMCAAAALAVSVVALPISVLSSGNISSASSLKYKSGNYVIGAELPLSGVLAQYGEGYSIGVDAYLNAVNDSGGINGHKVRYVALDDGNAVPAAVTDVQRLLSQYKANIIVGGILSNATVAYAPIIAKAKTPTLVASPVPQDVDPPASPYFFGVDDVLQPDEIYAQIQFAKAHLIGSVSGTPTVGLIYDDNATYASWNTNAEAAVPAAGWKVATDQETQPGNTNLSAQAAAIASANPDFVLAACDSYVASLLPALVSDGYTNPVVCNIGGAVASTVQPSEYPNFYTGAVLAFPYSPGAGVKTYVQRVNALGQGSYLTDITTIYGYLQAEVAGIGFKACGWPCKGTKLANDILTAKYQLGGVTVGSFGFTPSNHNGNDSVGYFKWNTTSNTFTSTGGTYTALP